MAEFVFTWKSQGIVRRRRSFAPRSAGDLWAWYKLGCKLIPECPNPKKESHWSIKSQDFSLLFIQFELHNKDGSIAHLTIDRRIPGM